MCTCVREQRSYSQEDFVNFLIVTWNHIWREWEITAFIWQPVGSCFLMPILVAFFLNFEEVVMIILNCFYYYYQVVFKVCILQQYFTCCSIPGVHFSKFCNFASEKLVFAHRSILRHLVPVSYSLLLFLASITMTCRMSNRTWIPFELDGLYSYTSDFTF